MPGYNYKLFSNTTAYTAKASWTSEATILIGTPNQQPTFPSLFFDKDNNGQGKVARVRAKGVLSSTGTPTYTFSLRLGTTAAYDITGQLIGTTAAITTASGVTNKYWELEADIICNIAGQGTNQTTISCAGKILSPGGFASPFAYAIEPTTPDTATWTVASFNSLLTYYLSLSCACSASSASNTLQVIQLVVDANN